MQDNIIKGRWGPKRCGASCMRRGENGAHLSRPIIYVALGRPVPAAASSSTRGGLASSRARVLQKINARLVGSRYTSQPSPRIFFLTLNPRVGFFGIYFMDRKCCLGSLIAPLGSLVALMDFFVIIMCYKLKILNYLYQHWVTLEKL